MGLEFSAHPVVVELGLTTRLPTSVDVAGVKRSNVVLEEERSNVEPLLVAWEKVAVLCPKRIPPAVAFSGSGAVDTGAVGRGFADRTFVKRDGAV